MKNLKWLALLLPVLLNANCVLAEETLPNWQENTLTGDWGGARKALYQKGVDIQFVHRSDVLSNLGGGIKTGTHWMGNTESTVAIDLDKLAGWQGFSMFFDFHSHLGGKFNQEHVGSFNGVDNIEVTNNTSHFYLAWLQKNWLDDRISVLAGLYAVDSEFYVTNSSGIFLQPPMGIGAEFAASGQNGPSAFPLGALGVRVKYVSPSTAFYIQGALTDGVPGDPDNPRRTQIKLGGGDGTYGIVEVGYTPAYQDPTKKEPVEAPANYMHKTAFGVWHFTKKMDDLMDVTESGEPKNRTAYGAYFLAERPLYIEKEDNAQGLTGFFRLGYANKEVHQSDWSSSVGLHYVGLINGRNDDIAGVGATISHASAAYQAVNDADSHEVNFEITYKAQIKPWLFIQPNLQYVVNPGMDKSLANAKVAGFRVEFEL
jgi:porin